MLPLHYHCITTALLLHCITTALLDIFILEYLTRLHTRPLPLPSRRQSLQQEPPPLDILRLAVRGGLVFVCCVQQ